MVCCLPGSRVTTRLRLRSSRSIDKATSCRRPKALRSLMEVSQTYRVEQKEKKATERLCIPILFNSQLCADIFLASLLRPDQNLYITLFCSHSIYV